MTQAKKPVVLKANKKNDKNAPANEIAPTVIMAPEDAPHSEGFSEPQGHEEHDSHAHSAPQQEQPQMAQINLNELHADIGALVQQNRELMGMMKEMEKDNHDLRSTLKKQENEIQILKNSNPNQDIDHGPNFGLPEVEDMRYLTRDQRILLMNRKFMKDAKRGRVGKNGKKGSGMVTGELTQSTAAPYSVNLTPRS